MVQRKCEWRGCGKVFYAKTADVRRGWGRFCCKRCKAMEQESRTGQNRRFRERMERKFQRRDDDCFGLTGRGIFDSDGNLGNDDFGDDWAYTGGG